MKNASKHTNKKVTAKGDRLHWASLKEVKSVKLTVDLTDGKLLTPEELEKRAGSKSNNSNLLVP